MAEAAPTPAVVPGPEPTMAQRLAAEGLGTFVLVFFGCSAALVSGGDYVATGLAFGLTVLVMAYAVGHISGGHFNPAVSVGAAISGRMPWRETGIYAAVQMVAGVVAGLVLLVISKLYDTDGALASVSNNYKQTSGSWDWLGGLLAELIATALFVFVILAVTDKRRDGAGIPAPLVIGLALSLVHFASMGLTGTSVNPARSFGPALFAGWDSFQQVWLFILAPLAGAVVAGFGYPAVFGWDRERPVRTPRAPKAVAGPPAWDPAAQQQWAGGEPGHAWQQPPAAWGQPEAPGDPQQWAGGTPGGGWGQPDPAYPQGQPGYGYDPYAQPGYPQQPPPYGGYPGPGYDQGQYGGQYDQDQYDQGPYDQGPYDQGQYDQGQWAPDPQAPSTAPSPAPSAEPASADDTVQRPDGPSDEGRTQIRPTD